MRPPTITLLLGLGGLYPFLHYTLLHDAEDRGVNNEKPAHRLRSLHNQLV